MSLEIGMFRVNESLISLATSFSPSDHVVRFHFEGGPIELNANPIFSDRGQILVRTRLTHLVCPIRVQVRQRHRSSMRR